MSIAPNLKSSANIKPLDHRRVLVVEDEYFLAEDMRQALLELGAEVVGPVATTEEAVACLAGPGGVAVAVLDIILNGQAVYPLADELRARGVPFVFGTGYDEPAIRPEYREVPCWRKPFEAEHLARALPGLLASA